ADAVVAAVARCPSGALRARRRGEAEPPRHSEEVVVTVSADGPLLVRGPLRIRNAAGETIATADAAALCRCGGTANPPYCDGTHTRIGFAKRCP
ncbi:MAG: CDGSH iron-sulfur domain-containing protein, partial [Gemmatimonadales bacterium]